MIAGAPAIVGRAPRLPTSQARAVQDAREGAADVTTGPSPGELYEQAGGDGGLYRELLREHGYLIPLKPGEQPAPLPCGWPGANNTPQQWHERGLDFQPIRDALVDLGVKQTDYALALGVTPKHVSRVLNGIDTPTVRLLVEMARQVGLVWRLVPADDGSQR